MKNWTKGAALVGGILGLTALILGAYGAHGLKESGILNENQLNSYETGVRIQMYHGLLLLILSLFGEKRLGSSGKWCFWGLSIGTLFFSGSIYVLLFTALDIWFITPLGGGVLMLSWAWMIWCLWKNS